MAISLILALALSTQSPAPAKAKAKPTPTPAPAAASAEPSAQRKEDLAKTIQKRKATAAQKKATRTRQAELNAAQTKALRDWEAKVGPAVAAQQREAYRAYLQEMQTQAMANMAATQQQQAMQFEQWMLMQMQTQKSY